MQIMAHTQFCLGLTALTGERLERLYLFSRLKHLLEYISVYELSAEVTTAFRTSVARLGGLPPNWASFDRLGPENNALGG